jgi:hypothetical protein
LEKLTLFENILLVHLIMQKPLLIFSCQNQPDGIKHEGIINQRRATARTHFAEPAIKGSLRKRRVYLFLQML